MDNEKISSGDSKTVFLDNAGKVMSFADTGFEPCTCPECTQSPTLAVEVDLMGNIIRINPEVTNDHN